VVHEGHETMEVVVEAAAAFVDVEGEPSIELGVEQRGHDERRSIRRRRTDREAQRRVKGH
jgi:tmRNA-binding protein